MANPSRLYGISLCAAATLLASCLLGCSGDAIDEPGGGDPTGSTAHTSSPVTDPYWERDHPLGDKGLETKPVCPPQYDRVYDGKYCATLPHSQNVNGETSAPKDPTSPAAP